MMFRAGFAGCSLRRTASSDAGLRRRRLRPARLQEPQFADEKLKDAAYGPQEPHNNKNYLFMIFIAGPCVIESAELLDIVAERLTAINRNLGTEIIFKASFDKANRTSISSFRGPGLDRGLQMLADVRAKWGL